MDFNELVSNPILNPTITKTSYCMPIIIEQEVFNRLSTISDMSTLHLELGDKPYLHTLMLDVIQKHLFQGSEYEQYSYHSVKPRKFSLFWWRKPPGYEDSIIDVTKITDILKLFLFSDNSTNSQELLKKYNAVIANHDNWILNSFPIDLIHKAIKTIQNAKANDDEYLVPMNRFHNSLIIVHAIGEISIVLSKIIPTFMLRLPNMKFKIHHGSFNCVMFSDILNYSIFNLSTLPENNETEKYFNEKMTKLLTHKTVVLRINKGSVEIPDPPDENYYPKEFWNKVRQNINKSIDVIYKIMYLSIVCKVLPYIYLSSYMLPRQIQPMNKNKLTPIWTIVEYITPLNIKLKEYHGLSELERLSIGVDFMYKILQSSFIIHNYGFLMFDQKWENYGVTNTNQIVFSDFDLPPYPNKQLLDMKINITSNDNGLSLIETYEFKDMFKYARHYGVEDLMTTISVMANIYVYLTHRITEEHIVFNKNPITGIISSSSYRNREEHIYSSTSKACIYRFLSKYTTYVDNNPDITLRQLYIFVIDDLFRPLIEYVIRKGVINVPDLDKLLDTVQHSTYEDEKDIEYAISQHIIRMQNLGQLMASKKTYKGGKVNVTKNLSPLNMITD